MRKFEIYIPDRQNWHNLKSVAKYYQNEKIEPVTDTS